MNERAKKVQHYSNMIHSILTPEQSIRYEQWALQHRPMYREMLRHRSQDRFSYPSGAMSSNEIDLKHETAVAAAAVGGSSSMDHRISAILKKPDQELTVEDVTLLLSTLSKTRAKEDMVHSTSLL
jgi:hypothetical protein